MNLWSGSGRQQAWLPGGASIGYLLIDMSRTSLMTAGIGPANCNNFVTPDAMPGEPPAPSSDEWVSVRAGSGIRHACVILAGATGVSYVSWSNACVIS
jgi:hypothetical protein